MRKRHPGPDGFPILFYSKFWDIISEDFSNPVQEFVEGKAHLDKINYSQVVFITKKEGANEVGDFRPICLLNRPFKIISKVLANRLKIVLADLVEEYQTGFISGYLYLGWGGYCLEDR